MASVTQLLEAIQAGKQQAAEELLPLVYDELRKLARHKLAGENPGQTLQPTALVHEAYLRLVGDPERESDSGAPGAEPISESLATNDQALATPSLDNRGHFFAAAAEAMRRILVESARRKKRLKRGGELAREPLEGDAIAAPEMDGDLLELDAALDKLSAKDARKAELVKLRYFAGLTMKQAAAALEISTTTADRDWAYARAWLFREMAKSG